MIKKTVAIIFAVSTIQAVNLRPQTALSQEMYMSLKEFYNHKKVLVTGGCGFIGSHIVEKLKEFGARVSIIDDLSTGFKENIEPFDADVSIIEKSIIDQEACDQAVEGNEIIFHLAAYTSVPGSVKDPTLCHKINVDGTFNLLQSARKYGVKRFVLSSSSTVYGAREDICYETDTNLAPVAPYGATKLINEIYCKQFSLLFNVPCVILRYFNVFGPRQNPDSQYAAAYAKFQQCMEQNKPITIFGNGMQSRDFVHVKDVALANLIVGMAPENEVSGQAYNIGIGKSITILELAAALKKQYPQYTQETQFAPPRDGDVMHTQMSAEKFNALKEKVLKASNSGSFNLENVDRTLEHEHTQPE